MMGMGNKKIKILAVFAVIIIATLVTKQILIGSAKAVSLAPAPPLTGIVAQSLYAGGSQTTLPVAGRDFTLADVHYFDGNDWAVATVKPINNSLNRALVILQRKQGMYIVVGGPGSAFPSDYLLSLPADVGNYLENQGVFYEPTAGQ